MLETDLRGALSVLKALHIAPFHYVRNIDLQLRLAIIGTVDYDPDGFISDEYIQVTVSMMGTKMPYYVRQDSFYRVSPGLDLVGTPELSFKGSPALLPVHGEEILIVLEEDKETERWCLYNEYQKSLPLGDELYSE